MERKQVLETVLRGIRRLTRRRTLAFLAVLFFVGALTLWVRGRGRGQPSMASTTTPSARPQVASLAGAPEQGVSAGGDVVQVKRLVPQVGQILIRYFEPQATQPPHVSFVERNADSTKLFWFPLRECESERKCPYWPWWRKPDVNVIVVPDDFVVGIMGPHNTCYGRLGIHADSDYALTCRGQRLRVVSAPSSWRGGGQLPRTEWLAAFWQPAP
jgi:hypothetical protein